MVNVQLSYNPYTVKTELCINGKEVGENTELKYIFNKRLQEWIEPKGSWSGIFKALRNSTGDSEIKIEYTGTKGDYQDLEYARDKYGKESFSKINLIHKNKETAENADPYKKMEKLKKLYKKLQEGPVEEFKTPDIQKNFETAMNSEFKIVIIAPMSSGKSTLINAIIGRDLLPAVNQATTAVITEIKDNDQLEDFFVSADNKYGKNEVKNEKATKKLISELNYKKDPKDPEGKEALIRLVQLEGPVPNLPSEVLSTVFVDTPGGNNSQNDEHEEMMNEAINDENKSLILYVFNGAQLGTNDSNIILKRISNAMKNSSNGKQSRDRFLFVANRMDEYDVDEEPYEDVIANTIIPQLESNGITEPNLFLASAQTAKLIRMSNNGENLSETEEEDLEKFVKRFNRQTRVLTRYASLSSSEKDRLIEEADKCAAIGKESDSKQESETNRFRAAELNSGIPAIEAAIKEYLEKYAIAIKIKTVHDTFMKKVTERNMIDRCEEEWAESKEKFENIKRELKEKQEKYEKNNKLSEFKEKVDSITLDKSSINGMKASIIGEIDDLVINSEEKIKKEEAEFYLQNFVNNLQKIGENAQVDIDNKLNNEVMLSCQQIIEEYSDYIQELNDDGTLSIGNFDMKDTCDFSVFEIKKPEDLLKDKKYIKKVKEKNGKKRVEKSGFFARISRLFGGGYEYIDDYKDVEYVNLKELIQDQITPVQNALDNDINNKISETEVKINNLKNVTKEKLDGLDNLITDLMNDINSIVASQEVLKKKVAANKKKAKWVKDFIKEVDDLLTV